MLREAGEVYVSLCEVHLKIILDGYNLKHNLSSELKLVIKL